MADMIRSLLVYAKNKGCSFRVHDVDEVDYQGDNVVEALKACKACDTITLTLLKDGKRLQSAMIVLDVDPGEEIADYTLESDLISNWFREWNAKHI